MPFDKVSGIMPPHSRHLSSFNTAQALLNAVNSLFFTILKSLLHIGPPIGGFPIPIGEAPICGDGGASSSVSSAATLAFL